MSKYGELNVWNKWGTLRRVVLGSMFNPEYFARIKDDRVRTPLQRVVEETLEDLENFATVLKQCGVEVIRPELPTGDFIDAVNTANITGATTGVRAPPLTPRDEYIVLGNKGFSFGKQRSNSLKALFDKEEFTNVLDPEQIRHLGASIFQIGRDVIVNISGLNSSDIGAARAAINSAIADARIHMVRHFGHSDGGFHPLKPGAFLTLESPEYYVDTYPGWEPCFLEGESWSKVGKFLEWKEQSRGKFWIPGEEDNKLLAETINLWLNDWVGYVEESVFDVNVLMLDEHHMFTSNINNEKVLNFTKKHNIELIHIPWRHRYFWDGGLHCITQELYRDGKQEDYWPGGRNIVIQ